MRQFLRRLWCIWDGHLFGCVNDGGDGRYCARCGADWWNENGR